MLIERDAFEMHFRRENDCYQATGQYFEIIRWENFLDSVSKSGKQCNYNQTIKDCIFVSLYATKAGKFSEDDFDTAYAQFDGDGVLAIITFFNDVAATISSTRREDANSLWNIQDKPAKLGLFDTVYQNTEDLLLHFSQQLLKLTDLGNLK